MSQSSVQSQFNVILTSPNVLSKHIEQYDAMQCFLRNVTATTAVLTFVGRFVHVVVSAVRFRVGQ